MQVISQDPSVDNVNYVQTHNGYYIAHDQYKLDAAAKVQKLISSILHADTLTTRSNINNYKRIMRLARDHELSVHVRVGKYNMDVISKNGAYTIILRSPKLMVYNDNGKLTTHQISLLVKH